MLARIKIITVIYIFILASIVILADIGRTQYLFSFIGSFSYGDKIGHFCLMGMFSLLVNLVLNAKTLRFRKSNYLLGSLIVLTIVTLEECSQLFISGRNFDLGDLAFDWAGILILGETARFICRKFIFS